MPPLALSADKATYKHHSRQFLSGITIIPGAENLLALVSFGQPVVKDGSDGPALAQEMKKGLDEFDVVSCQIESAVFDDVYFHCNIEKHFNSLYGLKDGVILYSHDALHKSGLVDTHMCKKKHNLLGSLILPKFVNSCFICLIGEQIMKN